MEILELKIITHTFLINWDFINKLDIAEEPVSLTTGQ